MSVQAVLALQRAAGNAATTAMIRSGRLQPQTGAGLARHPAQQVLGKAQKWLAKRTMQTVSKHVALHLKANLEKRLHGVFRSPKKLRAMVEMSVREASELAAKHAKAPADQMLGSAIACRSSFIGATLAGMQATCSRSCSRSRATVLSSPPTPVNPVHHGREFGAPGDAELLEDVRRWTSTVPGLTNSAAPTSRFVAPRVTASASRGRAAPGAAARRGRARSGRARRGRATARARRKRARTTRRARRRARAGRGSALRSPAATGGASARPTSR